MTYMCGYYNVLFSFIQSAECMTFLIASKLTSLPFAKQAVLMTNNEGRTPLHLSAMRNDIMIADKLLNAGACVDLKDNVSMK